VFISQSLVLIAQEQPDAPSQQPLYP
jgi:hypothetical protein